MGEKQNALSVAKAKVSKLKCFNALTLKLIACALMLCDHMWQTVIRGNNWMTQIGRLAFPVFAFQVVEGFFHTKDFYKYLKRMFLFALISEIPFNLMVGGSVLYPIHQNVLFTFCISLLLMKLLEKAKKKGLAVFLLASAGAVTGGFLLGMFTFVDYHGYGVLMVLLFYFTRNIPFGWLIQLAGMIYINQYMMRGLVLSATLFGKTFEFTEQSLAVFALILIWLYNGKQGPKNKPIQYACYWFYPVHMMVLFLLSKFAV